MAENVELKKKVRNSTLLSFLKDMTDAFVEALDKPFSADYGSWYDRVKALVEADSDFVARLLEIRPDLEEIKLGRCLLSKQKCLEAFQNADISRKPPHASTVDGYQDEFAHFLGKLLNERERMRIRGLLSEPKGLQRHFDRIFLESYLRYEDYLYSDSISDFLVCPLQNFISLKEIELENQLVIRKIKQEEFHRLVDATEQYGYELQSYPEFVLYVALKDRNSEESIQRTVTSLRLLKKERIGLRRIFHGYAFPYRPWEIADAPEGTGFAESSPRVLFILEDSEEHELTQLLALLNRSKETGYLAMSVRRFNVAYERGRPEDRWVDLFISLESLYSKASETTEVTHRLATRVSRVLGGGTLEGRKNLRDKAKEWYIIRSKIVHGAKVSVSQTQLEELEQILRDSLKWFAANADYANHDKLIDLLDLATM